LLLHPLFYLSQKPGIGLGSAVSYPSGVRGRAPTAKVFLGILAEKIASVGGHITFVSFTRNNDNATTKKSSSKTVFRQSVTPEVTGQWSSRILEHHTECPVLNKSIKIK